MTGIPVRDTQFASWIDPDAWMEKMEGPRWKSLVIEERAHITNVMKKNTVQNRLGKYEAYYRSANEKVHTIPFQCGSVHITWINSFFKSWTPIGSTKEPHLARDLIGNESTIWATDDVSDGAESFELQCWNVASETLVWKKYPVGPDLGLLDTKLYYLNIKNKLIYNELWCCDALTGKNEKCIYREKSKLVNLSLEKHANGKLKFIRENSQDIEVYEILSPNQFVKQSTKHKIPSSWIVPIVNEYSSDYVWEKEGLLLLRSFGKMALWKCSSNKSPKKLIEIPAGEILIDPYAAWAGTIPILVRVVQPDTLPVYYIYNGNTLTLVSPVAPSGLKTERIYGISKDGTKVYGIVTYNTSIKPTKLLMIGYGAYGMKSNVGSVLLRWAPLLQSGFAIGHTFIRGGGDHTEEWAKAGRRQGRKYTIEDFITLVLTAQDFLKISPYHTCIYGRSAGGLVVGDTLSKYPNGELMCAVYTEVPYVDELRTTTNTTLPLTQLEFNEFGYPAGRLEDFIGVGLLSPVDSASVIKTPNVFVLTRTAENDSQVFPYESVKWIRKLRQGAPNGAPKLCIVEKDQGHFTPPDSTIRQWSFDCAILDSWIEGDLST